MSIITSIYYDRVSTAPGNPLNPEILNLSWISWKSTAISFINETKLKQPYFFPGILEFVFNDVKRNEKIMSLKDKNDVRMKTACEWGHQ